MNAAAFRPARSFIADGPDQDAAETSGLELLTSIKQATGDHQMFALSRGYNSMAELAIDELLAVVSEHAARITALEERLNALDDAMREMRGIAS